MSNWEKASKTLKYLKIDAFCNREGAVKLLEKGMRDFAKGYSIQFGVFRAETLTDKDFTKEFQKNVLESAKAGKQRPFSPSM